MEQCVSNPFPLSMVQLTAHIGVKCIETIKNGLLLHSEAHQLQL